MDEVSANFRLIGPSNGTKIDGTHLTTTVFVFHGRVKFLWIFLEQNVCNLSPAGSPFLLYSCIVKFQAVQGPRSKKKRRTKRRVLAITNFCQEHKNQQWLCILLFPKKRSHRRLYVETMEITLLQYLRSIALLKFGITLLKPFKSYMDGIMEAAEDYSVETFLCSIPFKNLRSFYLNYNEITILRYWKKDRIRII